jgi:Putative zinc-finger
VRCSLLALSSYIDTELDQEPAGELEAHLVACDRCRTAIGHLREESVRIGALARVHVPDDAVHDLFSQIGLIAEEDELPEGPVHRDRPAPVEAPPWFGVERGAALPWAPRPTAHDSSQPRELMGERSPVTAVVEPPELLLWDEAIDQIDTAIPEPPPVHVVHSPEPAAAADVDSDIVDDSQPYPIAFEPDRVGDDEPSPTAHVEQSFSEPQPPAFTAAVPQPPDLSTSAPLALPPRLATGPNAFQRLRDAVAVCFALRRGGDADFDSGVEIVSGIGAPRWDQRTRPRHWNDSRAVVATAPVPAVTAPTPTAVTPPAPVVAATTDADDVPALAVIETPSPPSTAKPNPLSRFMARISAVRPVEDAQDAVPDMPGIDSHLDTAASDAIAPRDERKAVDNTAKATPPPELADVLSEVASLAAPLERTQTPATNGMYAAPESWMDERPAERTFEYRGAGSAPALEPELDSVHEAEDETRFGVASGAVTAPPPGRHLRRLQSQRSDRRDWNPAQPVTGRHVLPLGGPAVGAADRDRRLWLFGAVTVVLMLLGLLIGRQVTQTRLPVAATLPKATAPAVQATSPPTASLPVATPAPTAIIPSAPTPQQLTGAKTLGTGSSGFSVADVRYGEHPNDFRLVFDMAFPDTVTGDPNVVIGYDGPTTLYVEFTGVAGASNIATMPAHQVVMSVAALPMARNTNRLIFKITLSKNAPFDAYYLSGARLVIDIT